MSGGIAVSAPTDPAAAFFSEIGDIRRRLGDLERAAGRLPINKALVSLTEDFCTGTATQVGVGAVSIAGLARNLQVQTGDEIIVTLNAYLTTQAAGATYVDLYVGPPPLGTSPAQVPGSITGLYPLASEGTYSRSWRVTAAAVGTLSINAVLRQVGGGTGSCSTASSIVIAQYGNR